MGSKAEVEGPRPVDFSELSSYIRCPRLWYARHYRDLAPNKGATPLEFGAALHAALNELYLSGFNLDHTKKYWRSLEFREDLKRNKAVGENILSAYQLTYAHQPVEALQYETLWEIPVNEHMLLCGRIDKIVKMSGRIYVMDHKTTTQLGSYYFEQYHPHAQVGLYLNAARRYYSELQGFLVDAIFVGKAPRFERDVIELRDEEIDRLVAEALEWARRMLSVEHALKESPDEWRTTCPRAMIPEACNAWGGCQYRNLCRTDFWEKLVDFDFHEEPWIPNTNKLVQTKEEHVALPTTEQESALAEEMRKQRKALENGLKGVI